MKNFLKKIVVVILTFEAKLIIGKYNPKVIMVTGSVGKTSTKDAIYSVISTKFFARKSEKSFNSEIGIPLTILGLPNAWNSPLKWILNIFRGLLLFFKKKSYPEWLILEIGADRPGDIKSICSWLKPDIAVITRLSEVPVHIEFFSSPKEIFEEKGQVVKALKKNGILILNNDDQEVRNFKFLTKEKVVYYGIENPSDIKGSNYSIYYEPSSAKAMAGQEKIPTGINFKVDWNNSSVPVIMNGGLGIQHVYIALPAIAIGISQSIDLVSISRILKSHKIPRGRMKIVEGINNSLIIDDSYNSSPIALEEALKVLKQIEKKEGSRKIAVLGDMLELGSYSVEEHKKAGGLCVGACDILVVVGIRARGIAEGAKTAGFKIKNIFQFENSSIAGNFLRGKIKKGDLVLVKGSQGVRIEKTVEKIMANPEKAGELLVRQEREWKER